MSIYILLHHPPFLNRIDQKKQIGLIPDPMWFLWPYPCLSCLVCLSVPFSIAQHSLWMDLHTYTCIALHRIALRIAMHSHIHTYLHTPPRMVFSFLFILFILFRDFFSSFLSVMQNTSINAMKKMGHAQKEKKEGEKIVDHPNQQFRLLSFALHLSARTDGRQL